MSSPIIETVNLRKRFGAFEAVRGVSFRVQKGEVFGLLGPNGAGKTTTIRMIYGFSPPTQGELRIFGLPIATRAKDIKARLGVCHQDNTLDPDLSVIENLHVFAGYFDLDRRRTAKRADELLELFALTEKRHDKVGTLSGGLARRLMLARALINEPDLLILDEPTTGLDPQTRHLLWSRLEDLRRQGLTILLTTHYMDEAAKLCDRLVIVDHGRVLVEGSPASLIAEHAGRYALEVVDGTDELLRQAESLDLEAERFGRTAYIYSDEERPLLELQRTACALDQRREPGQPSGADTGGCLFRMASLEDVFLRLTGRELRE